MRRQPCASVRGLLGMRGRQAIQPRDVFVHARVVLHGAGAQRIHAQVDRVVPAGEPREVADHFDFADFGKALDRVAREIGAQRRSRIDGRNIERRKLHAALSGRGFLEDQRLRSWLTCCRPTLPVFGRNFCHRVVFEDKGSRSLERSL